jgi:hypothetical protein
MPDCCMQASKLVVAMDRALDIYFTVRYYIAVLPVVLAVLTDNERSDSAVADTAGWTSFS